MQSITPARQACNDRPAGIHAQRGAVGLEWQAGRSGKTAVSLGTNAKYKYKPEIDPETGEILGVIDPMEGRVQRFILQSVARKFLPKSRTDKCLMLRQKGKDIEVWKSKEFKTASYAGLQTCGSVWACPVCAAKIAERRRAEIQAAMAAHKAAGGCVNMLTLTCPHQRTDNLAELLVKQAKALALFWSDRVSKVVFEEMGNVGQIRALEVTHGRKSDQNNGWHPHYHVLQFGGLNGRLNAFDAPQMKDWQVRLYLVWARCCVRAGLGEPSYAHGLKLDDGSKAAKYVSKWGLEDEMTKGHTKKALHGETPFDFLRSYLADKEDKQAGALFREFAQTFKGKRQLHWSKGLKKRYAIGEKTDEEVAATMEDAARLLGFITLEQWRDVIAAGGRGTVLMLAASGGWESVQIYLSSIRVLGMGEAHGSEAKPA
ncbi:MAG: protein rep [bacterium]